MSRAETARRRARWLLVGLALLVALLPLVAHADATDDAVRRVGLKLQCPVCEGQTVADSPSGLAQDMRAVIRARVLAGATDQQILDEFVASYGDAILTDPPKRGISLGVWFGPLVALVLGTGLLVTLARAWRRRAEHAAVPGATASAAPASLDPLVADELTRFREEFGR